MCRDGRGTEKNLPEALKWFAKAAEKNDADAQYELGTMFEQGNGVAKDQAQAVKWYQAAVTMNHAVAKAKLQALRQPTMALATGDS
ncbi:MAG: tetratricopeptide repeat protein [bacterium]